MDINDIYHRYVATLPDCALVNAQTLREILTYNQDCTFGRQHSFRAVVKRGSTPAQFAALPLQSYASLSPYIARIAAGEDNILTKDPVEFFAGTSGTTGPLKYIPRTLASVARSRDIIAGLRTAVLQREAPDAIGTGPTINIMSMAANNSSRFGHLQVMSSTNFGMRQLRPYVSRLWTSPADVFELEDGKAQSYLHALFGLQTSQPRILHGSFAPHVTAWIVDAAEHWPRLVRDLRSGTICPDLNLPAGTRAALSPILRPNPARAETVARAFGYGLDAILQRLWPDLRVLCSVTTGSFAATVPRLRTLLGPDISLFSGTYAASEAVIGVQLELDSEHYTLANGSAYFEFVPIADADSAQPTTVGPGDLEPGHEYEVVVTTTAGLYRYRLGDVIRVTGRQGSTPRFTFSYRLGTVLDLLGEKTTEVQARQAILAAAEQSLDSDAVVNSYALARSPQDLRSRYLVFVELWPDGGVTTAQLQTFAENIEYGLRHYNQSYWTLGGLRGRMEPVRLILLPTGSLDRIWRNDRRAHQGASSQWKARNLVSSDADIESLTRIALWMGSAATSPIDVCANHH